MAENKSLRWKYFFVVLVVILLGIFLFSYKDFTGNSVFSPYITGNVALESSTVYKPNSNLEGDFKIILKQGELLPSDSKVLVSLNDNNYEYALSDLVSDDKTEGDFYLENTEISGSGEGYGSPGISNVDFVMKITKKSEQNNDGSSSSGGSSEISENELEASDTETTDENTESNSETNESSSETSDETDANQNFNSQTEESTGSNEESAIAESSVSEQPSEESAPNEKENNKESKAEEKQENKEEKSNENSESSESQENSANQGAPITGSAISNIFRITGRAISETSEEIKGSVSKDNPYTYELKGGETAEIISSGQPVELSIDGKIVSITTEYGGEGFGEDYLGDDIYELSVDLSSLNIKAEEGNLKISLVYNGQEINSVTSSIEVETEETTSINESESDVVASNNTNITETNATLSNQTLSNVTITNQTINATTNATIVKASTDDYALSEEELSVLKSKTGSGTVSITKSEVVNDRLIIRFQIGDYWLENSYDPSMEDLDYQISLDRVKWVKFLAQSFTKSESTPETAESYLGEYTL